MRLSTLLVFAVFLPSGCTHPPEMTSVPASQFNQCEPPGMPFYMPKPLLVVSKNVRHIGEAKVGLTQPAPIPNAFDDQASYADVKANVTSPGKGGSDSLPAVNAGAIARGEAFDETAPSLPDGWRGEMIPKGRVQDGHNLTPDSFYTYQIIFVPDLSQKYGLRIKGKPGEVRAAMNLVNGWMYTGMGPYYLKDSSTAQNIMAVGVASMFAGRGASDVLDSVTGLASAAGTASSQQERAPIDSDEFIERVARLARVVQSQTLTPREMLNFAEVAIYEPTLNPVGGMDWRLIAHHNFDRQFFSPNMNAGASEMLQQLINQLNPAESKSGKSVSNDDPVEPSDPGDTSDPANGSDPSSDPSSLRGGAPQPQPGSGDSTRRPPIDVLESSFLPPVMTPDGQPVVMPEEMPSPSIEPPANLVPAPIP